MSTRLVPSYSEHYTYCLVSPLPSCPPSSSSPHHQRNASSTYCLPCEIPVDYFLSPQNGYVFCVTVTILTCLFGIFGTLSNTFTIFVVKRNAKKCSFTTLLTALALYDLGICLGGSIYIPAYLAALGNLLDRTERLLKTIHTCLYASYSLRTCSKYTTVLITLERYLAVKHPCRSRSWFTIPRARTYCFIVLSSSLALGLPTALSFTVTKNPTYPQDESQFPFKFVATSMATRFSKILPLITLADFLLPLIALSTLNSLLFYELLQASRRHCNLSHPSLHSQPANSSSTKLSTAKMFIGVYLVLISCQVLPFLQQFSKVYYRRFPKEMAFLTLLCVVVNSSVNFLIYWAYGTRFREWCHSLLRTTRRNDKQPYRRRAYLTPLNNRNPGITSNEGESTRFKTSDDQGRVETSITC